MIGLLTKPHAPGNSHIVLWFRRNIKYEVRKLSSSKISPSGDIHTPVVCISNQMGLKYDSGNYLLMHAMGPNVAGVIGSAVAAGVLLAFLS